MTRRNRRASRAVPFRRCARCRHELGHDDEILCRRCATTEDRQNSAAERSALPVGRADPLTRARVQ